MPHDGEFKIIWIDGRRYRVVPVEGDDVDQNEPELVGRVSGAAESLAPKSLGRQILEFRIKHGLEQKDFAALATLTQPQVSWYENDKRKPRAGNLLKIYELLKKDRIEK
ncbi:MAG: helix-turn-helix transcriptional regulator [Deltaproteobacteria bacterium]|nr:helix-turn-helix transcriptional regulator [Deltaproteobacteria bacterium]